MKTKGRENKHKKKENIKLSLYMYSIITLPSNKNSQISGLNLKLIKHLVYRLKSY